MLVIEFRTKKAATKRYVCFSDALIEMVGDSSVDSSPWVPPDKYYNPGSHINLKCIIRQQLSKHKPEQHKAGAGNLSIRTAIKQNIDVELLRLIDREIILSLINI